MDTLSLPAGKCTMLSSDCCLRYLQRPARSPDLDPILQLEEEVNRMFKVSACCQKIAGTQWRYWFSADKHPSRTFPGRVPRVSSANSGGKRSSNEHQLGLNDKAVRAFLMPSFFIYFQRFWKILASDSQWHLTLTTSQVTLYMYAIHCKCNKVNNIIHNINSRSAS